MLKFTAFTFLFFISSFYLSAQQKLSGKVVEKTTNTPVAFATIQVKDAKSTLTNENGEFELNVKELPATIMVSHLNYIAAGFKVITADQALNLSLSPQVMTLKEVAVGNPAVAIMRAVSEKAFKNYNKSFYGKAFLRQIAYDSGKPTYLNEIVLDAEWKAFGIVNWNPLQARHLKGSKGVSYTNTSFYSFIFSGYMANNLHKKPVLKSVDSLYAFRLAGTFEQNGQEIAKIICTPRKMLKGIRFEGTYYVNTVTDDVIKIEGLMKGLYFTNQGAVTVKNIESAFIAQYKLNKDGDNVLDYSVFNTTNRIKVLGIGAQDTDLYSTLYMIDDEPGNKSSLKALDPEQDDSKLVMSMTYNNDYWVKNQGIKRSEKEQAAIEILEKIPQVKK